MARRKNESPKKKRKSHAVAEIRKYQKSTALLIRKAPFCRLVKGFVNIFNKLKNVKPQLLMTYGVYVTRKKKLLKICFGRSTDGKRRHLRKGKHLPNVYTPDVLFLPIIFKFWTFCYKKKVKKRHFLDILPVFTVTFHAIF